MPEQLPAEAAALLATYQRQVVAQRNAVLNALERIWRSLGEYRNQQIATFLHQALPVIAGGQHNMSALTSGFLAGYRQKILGGRLLPVGVDPRSVTGTAIRGVPPRQVYERPFHLVWRQLADGTPPADAIQAGLDRTLQLAKTDLQLAKTHTSRHVLDRDRAVAGYRRVLEGAHSCGLCVVAATQRYHKSDLMPMHPACDCSVRPIYGANDPGHVVEPELLDRVHQSIRDTFGVSASDARTVDYHQLLVVHQHGELGPVLARRGRPFTGPNDL